MSATPERWHRRTTPDGWTLHVRELLPNGRPIGMAVVGHAMMVDGRTLVREDRGTFVDALLDAGFWVLVPDLRGHGRSGPLAPEGEWNYDDIVDDVGVLLRLARELAPDLPTYLVGHSLFGHASLAWLGQNPAAEVAGLVMIAVDVWNPRREPSWIRRWRKRLTYEVSCWVAQRAGYFPARRLKQGSNDESLAYWMQARRWIRQSRWTSADGRVDYDAARHRVSTPTLHVLSEGDRIYAHPASAAGLSAPLRRRELVVLGRAHMPRPLAESAPDHMPIITADTPENRAVWAWIADWMAMRAG